MDIGKSFGFVFEDENWVTKVLIGGVLGLIPIINLVPIGYALRTLKNVATGAERPLPEWDDFGGYLVKGLLVSIGGFIYAIPLLLLGAMSIIFSTLAGGGADQEAVTAIFGVCTTGLACVQVVYGVLLALWLPAAVVKYAVSGEFGAFFHLSDIWNLITRNLGGYIVAIIVAWVASVIAGMAGLILCLIGTIFTGFWATLVSAHLFGQLERQAGEVAPVPTM